MAKFQSPPFSLAHTLQLIVDEVDGSALQRRYFESLLRYSHGMIPHGCPEAYGLTLLAICGANRGCNGQAIRRFLGKVLRPGETLLCCDRHRLEGRYIAWVRRIYRYKEMDFYRRQQRDRRVRSLDSCHREEGIPLIDTLADGGLTPLERLLQRYEGLRVRELVTYLQDDPQGRLRACHPRRYPHCHAQGIIGDRLLREEPLTWQEISAKYGIAFGTVTAFYNRRVLKLIAAIALERFPDLAA